uniref:Uncharacterized protein n=1 Tax=Leptobrachium leishanense TaxID=445787 RepID=A0A8C5PL97_9ANUR
VGKFRRKGHLRLKSARWIDAAPHVMRAVPEGPTGQSAPDRSSKRAPPLPTGGAPRAPYGSMGHNALMVALHVPETAVQEG